MAAKRKFDWLHTAISLGASIVILGALFKILHIGGVWGNYMIGLGLGVEAFLFALTAFFPPTPEPAWERVYPELNPEFTGELPKASARAVNVPQSAPTTAALDNMLRNANVGPDLIESLGNGLRTFGDKVAAISNVADASSATTEYTNKIKSAMGQSTGEARAYHDQVNKLAKNLSALNAVYELELQDSSAHLKSMNTFYQNLSSTMHNFNESMEDSRMFKDEVAKLAKNLASLNAIYGNMLSAMNQPRV